MIGLPFPSDILQAALCGKERPLDIGCRAGMGRCQSGFCQSRVVEILARELGVAPSEVPLEDTGSWIVDGPLKNPGTHMGAIAEEDC